jgi:hypothetical protein
MTNYQRMPKPQLPKTRAYLPTSCKSGKALFCLQGKRKTLSSPLGIRAWAFFGNWSLGFRYFWQTGYRT